MFGADAILPIDRALKMVTAKPNHIDPQIIRNNADLNKRDAQHAYKEKTDEKANTDRFYVGDRVLKRMFGPHKKMSVRWKEDKHILHC